MEYIKRLQRVLNQFLLFKYQDASFILRQKASVLSAITLAAIVFDLLLFPVYYYYNADSKVLIPPIITLIVCLIALGVIRYGYFVFAGHLLFVTISVSAWISLFMDKADLIMKLDTIVFVLAAFTMLTLTEIKQKKVILFYLAANLALLLYYFRHLTIGYNLDEKVAVEYITDNIIALFFIGYICYQVVRINDNALRKANDSIEMAHQETREKKELAASLELKVDERTRELVKKNDYLQLEIKERLDAEKKLKKAQKKLVDTAHKAGMAEMAADSLHNVGNILNSVKVSAYVIEETIDKSPLESFYRACNLLQRHQDNFDEFIRNDPKGKKTIQYFLLIEKAFKIAFTEVNENIQRLNGNINAISDVIKAQQNYVGLAAFLEETDILKLLHESLAIIKELQLDDQIKIKIESDDIPLVTTQKSKLLHILINIIKNAVFSMQHNLSNDNLLWIQLYQKSGFIHLKISDTGEGIPPGDLKKIFNHGYSTWKGNPGFGLHSCANYAVEIGGTITAESEGPGKGALFFLKIPIKHES